jgi:hypothetical protein
VFAIVKAEPKRALCGFDGIGAASTLMHGGDLLHHLLVAGVTGDQAAGTFGVDVGDGDALKCLRCGYLLPGQMGARRVDAVPPLVGGIERGACAVPRRNA